MRLLTTLIILIFSFTIGCGENASVQGPVTNLDSASGLDTDSEADNAEPISFLPVKRLVNVSTFEGEFVSLSVEVLTSDENQISYRWYKDGALIQETLANTIDIPSATLNDGGQYKVDIIHTTGSTDNVIYSDEATVTIRPASEKPAIPAVTFQPQDQNITEGQRLTLEVGAVGIPNPTYQWYKDNIAIIGAQSAAYIIGASQISDSGSYHAVATNSQGTATSMAATVTVTQQLCNMPNGTTAVVGQSYTTGCRRSNNPVCQFPLNGVATNGTRTRHTCGSGGIVMSQDMQCNFNISVCEDFEVDEGG